LKNSETLRCRVTAYNFSPHGGVEGLIVEVEGQIAQIVFPHDTGTEVAQDMIIGHSVDLMVVAEPPSSKGEALHPVYRFISLSVAESPDGVEVSSPGEVAGVVARFNYARHGEANGVVLDSGDFIHLKPHGMQQIALRVGDHIEAKGKARPMELGGRVFEATSINGIRLNGKH
jgi:hypothetical protein